MAENKLEIVAEPDRPTIVTRRVVAAPRALVFDAFTKPEHLKRWMGPRVLTMVSCVCDLRVGGGWRMVHRAPDGKEFGFHGEFREILRPERIVRTFVFEPFPDQEALETLTLDEKDGKTTITTLTVHKTIEDRDGHIAGGRMEAGMTDGYARLDELLAVMLGDGAADAVARKPDDLVITRLFDAPRRLVFEAWTKAEHVSRWFAPGPLTMPSCEVDFRPDGVFRFVMRAPDGSEYPFEGAFREIVAGERIVFTGTIHEGNRTVTTITFAEHDGKTLLTMRQTFTLESDATRGAKKGWTMTLDQLGEHLARA